MIGFIIFIIVLIFVIIPLYKSIRKSGAAKKLNNELPELADKYHLCLSSGNVMLANVCSDLAQDKVRDFVADIRLSPQELAQVAPAVTRFPYWHTWL